MPDNWPIKKISVRTLHNLIAVTQQSSILGDCKCMIVLHNYILYHLQLIETFLYGNVRFKCLNANKVKILCLVAYKWNKKLQFVYPGQSSQHSTEIKYLNHIESDTLSSRDL